jgi:DNA-binding transcriptional LysR family regulator
MLEWDDLQTFLAIAREGSLSAAARALKTTQPTMGRRLQAMESRIGARLLERHPRGYVLTSLGETVLGNVERIEAEVIATERAISGRDVALEGVVRVTCVDVVASRILAPAIANLQCTHPKITVELNTDARTLNLNRREADIAVRLARFEGSELIVKKLGEMGSGFFASASYIEKYGMPNIENSAQHSIISVLDDQAHLSDAKALKTALPEARIAVNTNSRETMIHAAKNSIGICCVPLERAREESDLVQIDLNVEIPAREVWLGVHKDMRHMPRIRAVIDAISAGFTICRKAGKA